MKIKRVVGAGVAAAGLSLGALAVPASAAPPQEGLVNVALENVTIPIGVLANVCDVNVAVLTGTVGDQASECSAEADNQIEFGEGSGPSQQQGLVNVYAGDIAVPVSVVANVCDVNVAVLVDTLADDSSPCEGVTVNSIG